MHWVSDERRSSSSEGAVVPAPRFRGGIRHVLAHNQGSYARNVLRIAMPFKQHFALHMQHKLTLGSFHACGVVCVM